MKLAILIASGSLLAAASGYLASVALSQTGQGPARTVTVDVVRPPGPPRASRPSRRTRPTRGTGPRPAAPGPAATLRAPTGFSPATST